MRANIARRDNWAQIRIGACALLLPPLTLGAAFYSMLAAPDEGAARPPGAAPKAQVVRPELLRDARERAASAEPVEEMARPAPGSVQIVGAPPAGLPQPPPGEMNGALRGAYAPDPSWSAPAEVSTALLPRALIAASKAAPQTPAPRTAAELSAAQAPSAIGQPAAESPPAPPHAARKHARSETTVRRNAQRRQREFSLKDWLQQIGILPHDTRG